MNDNLKTGYKQTEVGVIPEDWEAARLGKYVNFRTGPFGSALHKSDYIHDGIPVVNPMHIINGHIIPSPTMSISQSKANDLADFLLKEGDVVIGRRGEMGRCAVVEQEHVDWLCGSGSMIIRCDNNISPWFLASILSTPATISAIEDTSVGTTMVNINQAGLFNLAIQLPPLPEQRAIAEALSDVDGLLAALDKLIAKKRAIKTATMQQLLTERVRLPGFGEKMGVRQTEIGVIPEDWEVLSLGELFKFKNGLNKAKQFFGNGTPIVNYMDVFNHSGLEISNIKGLVNVTIEEIKIYGIRCGDVFFTRTSETVDEIGIASVLLEDIKNGVFSGFILRARPIGDKLDLHFQKYCFTSSIVRKQITSTSSYTTRALTNGTLLSKVRISIPTKLAEQKAIAEILTDMDDEIAALEQRRAKTVAVKQGMMQALLTGEVRLV